MQDEKLIDFEEKENGNLKEVESEHLAFIDLPDNIDNLLAKTDKIFIFLDKVRAHCLSKLNKNQIVNQSGRPYVTEDGLNYFVPAFGIYEENVEGFAVKSDGTKISLKDPSAFQGEIRAFWFTGTIGSKTLGVKAGFEGGSFLTDGFKNKDDILFYSKKAKANWRGRGIRKLLSLSGLSWDELSKYGIKDSDVQKVEYSKTEKADSAKADECWNMLLALNNGNSEEAEKHCITLTSFKGKDGNQVTGKKRPHNLSDAALNILKGNLDKLVKKENIQDIPKTQKQLLAEIKEVYSRDEKYKTRFSNLISTEGITAEALKEKDTTFLTNFLNKLKEVKQ